MGPCVTHNAQQHEHLSVPPAGAAAEAVGLGPPRAARRLRHCTHNSSIGRVAGWRQLAPHCWRRERVKFRGLQIEMQFGCVLQMFFNKALHEKNKTPNETLKTKSE